MTHELQIERIIVIENSQLLVLENKILKNISKLFEAETVKTDETISGWKSISQNLSELVELRKSTDDTIEIEQKISEDLKKLKDTNEAKELLEKDNLFKRIVSDLDVVSKDYNDKKNLYDELRAEQEEVKRTLEEYDRQNNLEPDKIEQELNQNSPEEPKEKGK